MRATELDADTVILERRNRFTGSIVQLAIFPAEDPECRWTTICVAHSNTCGHRTRALATSFLAVPWEWCGVCLEP